MSIETTNYETEKLIAGQVLTRSDAPLAADTYYYGMPLVYNAATNVFDYSATTPQAIYIGTDARVLGAVGTGPVVTWGTLLKAGIVDSAGATLTIDEDLRQVMAQAGIFLK